MEFENKFTGERTKNRIFCLPGLKKRSVRIRQSAPHCGLVVCTLKKVKLFDLLGVFALRKRAGKTAQVLVLPQNILLNSELELEHPLMAQRKTASGGNPYGGYEIREYRPGDSLRNIHWKLSAKLNDYFVKEYNDTKPGTTMIFMSYAKDAAAMDQVVSFFCAFAAQMMEMRQSFSAMYLNKEGSPAEHFIETSNDLYDFLCAFLSVPFVGVQEDPFATYDPGKGRRLFCAREDGLFDMDRDCLIEGLYL
jgi:hypothetical protein